MGGHQLRVGLDVVSAPRMLDQVGQGILARDETILNSYEESSGN